MSYQLVILGAGLSGLRVANIAHELGIKNVLIIDYEKSSGGPFSSLFDQAEFKKEKELLEQSNGLSYEFWYQSTVVGFFPAEDDEKHQISVQTPQGSTDIEAEHVILCTGALEKPREAHKISGSRPAGVMTPTMAAGLIERGYLPGLKPIVMENNKTSEAIATILEEKNVEVNKVSSSDFKVMNIKGNSRVNAVEMFDLNSEEVLTFLCDTLIFSEGTIPSTFYLKGSLIDLDDEQYIKVDKVGRTNIPGVIALGSCTTIQNYDVFSEQTEDMIKAFLTN